jgi:ferritin-like metal-binding protein YciE
MPTKKTTTKVETKSKSTDKVEPKKDAAKSLDDLFEDSLKDALWAENAVKDALPKMIKNASSPKLKQALEDHLEETKEQIKILKDVFKSIGAKAEAEKCDAMAGILEEGEGILEETEPGAVRDAGIIAACQKVEHYEIASYGTMISYAKILKNKEAKQLIDSILKQEKNADKILSKLATSEINLKANK